VLFAGEGYAGAPVLHVLDKKTGASIVDLPLPGAVSGKPMSYLLNGKQYVVMTVASKEAGAELVALALQ
jgi:glucose dehydrogenase